MNVDAVSMAVLSVYGLLLVGTIILVVIRRNKQPLKVRDPYLLIAANICAYIGCFSFASFIDVMATPCWLNELFQPFYITLYILVLARFWKLFLISYLTHMRLSGQMGSWILRYPWLAANRNIWAGTLIVSATLCAIHASMSLSSPFCTFAPNVMVMNQSLACAWWVVVALLTAKLWQVRDGFFITAELKLLGAWILLFNIIIIGVLQTGIFIAHLQWVFILVSMGHLAIQMWFPLYKSFQMDDVGSTIDGTWREKSSGLSLLKSAQVAPILPDSDFLQILRHPDGFAAFKRFLTLEFSVENLLCWEYLNQHQAETGSDQIAGHFQHVYDVFVRENSPNEVNISSDLRADFRSMVEGRYEAILDPADIVGPQQLDTTARAKLSLLQRLLTEITKLMKYDSYRRFRHSTDYARLVAAAKPVTVSPSSGVYTMN